MNQEQINNLAIQAREHADNLSEDIIHASTRIEHIRLTRLALEADKLATELEAYVNV